MIAKEVGCCLVYSEVKMTRQAALKKQGMELPEVSIPGGSHVSVNIRENRAYRAFFLFSEKGRISF